MSLFSREHYELLSQFEREFKHSRLDKETKDLWPKGIVFQDGHVNELFLAYRKGHAFGKYEAQQSAGDVVRDAGMYLLQDTRSYVGNCVVWWAKDGNGYTTDVAKAHRYTFDEAMRQHRSRDTDLPWLCDEVLPLARGRVDVQDVHKMRSLDDQRAAIDAARQREGRDANAIDD